MKLAVSNIAWEREDELDLLSALRRNGVQGIEVAPTKVWPQWQGVTGKSIKKLRSRYENEGFSIPSLQALLFGKADLLLFGSHVQRSNLREHLLFCADLAVALGSQRLVFGAPRNRLRGSLHPEQAMDEAVAFFSELAVEYASRGVILCLEANPTDYGADFLTRSSDARRLVERINSAGIGVHLDIACMELAGESVAEAIQEAAPRLSHVHISQPFLGTFESPGVSHALAASTLEKSGYDGWICIEMRATAQPSRDLLEAVRFSQRTYLSNSVASVRSSTLLLMQRSSYR